MESDRIQHLVDGLRKAGLRVTMPRLAICRVLAQSREHPTAVQLHAQLRQQFPSLSLATIYNTLNALQSLGLVHDLGQAGDGQKHFDANTSPHANLICVRCHQIRDLDDRALERIRDRVSLRSGYRILGARIAYYGICPECKRQEDSNTARPAASE